jgi:transcriptional regulator with AAA-type ATPase domain/NAD-dependent dihydropyrimidine dehydrogenase PreA subunit
MIEQVSNNKLQFPVEVREPAKRLCEYFLAAGVCGESDVLNGLERQENLRAKGYDPFIGILLLDAGAITRKDLLGALALQDIDRLANSTIFSLLPKSLLADIHSRSIRQIFNAHEVIFRQKEKSTYVYIILTGTVFLSHKAENGKEIDISVHRAGEVFGEMSILAESPRGLTATSMEKTSVLAVPREEFLSLYREYPEVSQAAIRNWFNSILEGREESQVYKEHHHSSLLTKLETRPCLPLLGSSKLSKILREKVGVLCGSDRPVLLTGDPGSMKSRVSQFIHNHGNNSNGPYIIFDPAQIPDFIAEGLRQDEKKAYFREQKQMAALFGYDQETYGHKHSTWEGFLKLSHKGTLVIREGSGLEPKVQRLLLEYLKTGMYYPLGAERPAQARTRIIIEIIDDLNLENTLYSYVSADHLHLQPLLNRKRDLREIIQLLLRTISSKKNTPVKKMDQEALNRMMAYNWPGNFDELEDVVSRSVSLSKGDVILAEDVFIGMIPITGKKAFNLLSINFVRNFFQSPFYPQAPQIVVAAMFALVVVLGIWGNPSPDSNISLLLVWANWEPLLILSCLLLARIWCSFCPIGFISNLVRKIKLKRFKIPTQYLNYGFFVGAFGLAVIFWAQSALHMFERPTETAWLLLAMLGSAVLFALLFEGRIWCRYYCPLGQMVATFARAAIVEVRSNYNYCSHECTDYTCYTGNGTTPGCSMGKGPFAMASNQDCTLCGNCMKACDNKAVRLNLRSPGWELWNTRAADLAMILFVPLLWGTQIFRGLDLTPMPQKISYYLGSMEWSYAVLMLCSALAAYLVAAAGIAFMGLVKIDAGKNFGTTFILVMLPLVYANEIAIRLVPLLNHAADFFVILGNQIGRTFPHIAFRLDMQSIYILQVILIIIGFFLSEIVASKLIAMLPSEKKGPAFFLHLPLVIMSLVSILLF